MKTKTLQTKNPLVGTTGPTDASSFPVLLSVTERFTSWLTDILLSREESGWRVLTFGSVLLSFQATQVINELSLAGYFPGILRQLVGAFLFCLLLKGLDVWKVEKRLDLRRTASALGLAWLFMFPVSCYLNGIYNSFPLITFSTLIVYFSFYVSRAFLMRNPKAFLIVGTPTRTSLELEKFFSKTHWNPLRDCYVSGQARNVKNLGLSTIVLTRDEHITEETVGFLKDCLHSGINIVDEREFYTTLLGRLPVFGGIRDCDAIIGLHARLPMSEAAMRLFDITLALVALLLLSPLMIFIAFWIRWETPGPVLFIQERQGRNNVPFRMYKFRTMKEVNPNLTGRFTLAKDPRVTRAGSFLRHFHFDELPQLLNVLKGEMSLVGPRPEALFFAKAMQEKIPAYDLRYSVRPGITGWAQLSQGYVLDDIESTLEKISYDFYYLKRRNVWMDLSILLRTIFFIWNDTSYQERTKHADPVPHSSKS